MIQARRRQWKEPVQELNGRPGSQKVIYRNGKRNDLLLDQYPESKRFEESCEIAIDDQGAEVVLDSLYSVFLRMIPGPRKSVKSGRLPKKQRRQIVSQGAIELNTHKRNSSIPKRANEDSLK